jgi:hypothetical protein
VFSDVVGTPPNLFGARVLAPLDPPTAKMAAEFRFRFLMISVLRDKGLTTPFSFRKRPQALQRQFLISSSCFNVSLSNQIPLYAILSHRWEGAEVTFQDLSNRTGVQMKGYAKILGCCAQARKDGFEFAVCLSRERVTTWAPR